MIRDVSISLICFAFGFVLVSILTLLRRKDRVACSFLIFSIMAAGWGFFSALWLSSSDIESTYYLQKIAATFSHFIPVSWIFFVFIFIDKKEPVRFFYVALYLLEFF